MSRDCCREGCTCTLSQMAPEHDSLTTHVLAICIVHLQTVQCILAALKAIDMHMHMYVSRTA